MSSSEHQAEMEHQQWRKNYESPAMCTYWRAAHQSTIPRNRTLASQILKGSCKNVKNLRNMKLGLYTGRKSMNRLQQTNKQRSHWYKCNIIIWNQISTHNLYPMLVCSPWEAKSLVTSQTFIQKINHSNHPLFLPSNFPHVAFHGVNIWPTLTPGLTQHCNYSSPMRII